MNRREHFKTGMRDGIPVALGYLAVSFTFGIAAKKIGLTAFQSGLMSVTNLTSAGQFAALGIIAASAGYIELAMTQFIINLRYCLMSCALSQKLGGDTGGFHRLFMAFGISDEIFALSVSVKGNLSPFYTYGIMSLSIPSWTLGTVLGIILGNAMPMNLLSAFSVALYGMFIAIIMPEGKKNRIVAFLIPISMFASSVFNITPILKEISSGFKIILLTVLISGLAAVFFPVKEDKHEV